MLPIAEEPEGMRDFKSVYSILDRPNYVKCLHQYREDKKKSGSLHKNRPKKDLQGQRPT